MAEDAEMTYFAKLGLDVSEFLGGITDAQKGFLAFVGSATAAVAVFKIAFDEYSKLVQKYGQMANELDDLSYATGISTQEIQRFHYAAILSGDSIGMVDGLLAKLTLSMGNFADKASPAAKAFAQLGVDPSGKPTSEVFLEVAKALDEIENPGLRAAIAVDILGKGYRDSLPYMKDYIENEKKIKEFSPYSVAEQQNMKDYKRGLDDLGHSWEVFWGKVLFASGDRTRNPAVEQMWRDMGYTQEQINEMLKKAGYKIDAPTKSGAPTTKARAGFESEFEGLSEQHIALHQANKDLEAYKAAMDAAQISGDKSAFDTAALGARMAQIAIDKLTLSMQESGKVAEAVKVTYNTMFASSLQTGEVGPDAAGYSDLANMSIEELQAIVKKGELGGSKGQAERAQQYIDHMGKSGATTAGAKTTDPVTNDKKQIKSADELTTKLTDSYTTRLNAFTKYGDDMLNLYILQEQQDLAHWTAQTEMMRIGLQNMGDSWKEYVAFAANFPTIHNVGIVVWDKEGPDWKPESNPVFMQAARMASLASQELAFASADFRGVKLSTTKVDVKVDVKVDKNGNATATATAKDSTSQALAGAISQKSGG